jgi:transcriptional regulator with XRE-family HTH domain
MSIGICIINEKTINFRKRGNIMDSTSKKPDYSSPFAKKLRALLESHPKTGEFTKRTALAKELGATQQAVSQWAEGDTTPSLKHLINMASFFEISIDELVTGVAYDNKELSTDTGLSNLAIDSLKHMQTRIQTVSGDDVLITAEGNNGLMTVEFVNILIETLLSSKHNISSLAKRSMDYIIGAYDAKKRIEELRSRKQEGYVILQFANRPNFENDELDFRTFQLAKEFEHLIENLMLDPAVRDRVQQLYKDRNLELPNYKDRRGEELLAAYARSNMITVSSSEPYSGATE